MTNLAVSRLTGRPVAASSAVAAAAPQRHGDVPAGLERILRPAAFGRWILPQLSAITPTYIEQVLRGAFGGSHIEQWQLFDLMEDTWPRLAKNLNEIKGAVQAMNWEGTLIPWAEEEKPPTPSAEERARLVSSALWRMAPDPCCDENGFQGTLYDLLDAWAKGISVLEILWHIRRAGNLGDITAPKATIWIRPDNYAWTTDGRLGLNPQALDGATGTRARSYLTASQFVPPADVIDFPEDKFLIAIRKARTGHPISGALLRPLAWWWCAANFSADWLMNLAQIFGLPFRWANYADGTPPATIAKICGMLENMGSAAWAAFPEGTTIDFKEASKTGDASPQANLLDLADKNCDLLLLGQTLTSDTGGMGAGGGSLALGKVHASVKEANIQAAANWAAEIINRQLIPAILRLNYGDDEECPEFRPEPHEGKDQQGNADRDTKLLGAGVELPREWFYKRHGIPMPRPGEDTISRPTPTAPPNPNGSPAAAAAGDPPREKPEDEKGQEDDVQAKAAPLPPERLIEEQQRHLAEAAAGDLAFITQRGNALLKDLSDPNLDDNAKRQKAAEFQAWLQKVKPSLLRNPRLAEAIEESTAQNLANALANTARK